MDNSTGRAFVAHTSTGRVEVFDGKEGKWIGSIPESKKVAGEVYGEMVPVFKPLHDQNEGKNTHDISYYPHILELRI